MVCFITGVDGGIPMCVCVLLKSTFLLICWLDPKFFSFEALFLVISLIPAFCWLHFTDIFPGSITTVGAYS